MLTLRLQIYRRGIGVDKTTSYFPLEKANLLIELGVQWLCSKVMPKAPEKDKAPPTMGTHRAIGRVTLADVVDFKKNGIKKSLLEQNTLQEPTFREIVLLYRRKAPALPAPAPTATAAATAAAAAGGASAAPQSPAPQSTPSTPRQDEKGAPLSRSNSLSPSTSGSTPRSPSTTGLAAAHRHREHKDKEHREHKERKEKSVSRSPSTAELSKSTSNSSVSSTVSSSAASADAKPAHQHAQMTSNPLGINIKTCASCTLLAVAWQLSDTHLSQLSTSPWRTLRCPASACPIVDR